MRSSEDRQFARWCRRGDTRALAALFDRCAPRLLRLGIHLVGDASEAEDLVQATFLALIQQQDELDGARPAWPWLVGVLQHKASDARRRRARTPDPARFELRTAAGPVAELEARELGAELAAALDALAEPYRQPAVLRLRHDLAIAEIAHVLDRSPATVRVQLHRARELLRVTLPASLASSLLVVLAPAARGLPAVRRVVLQQVGAGALTASAATPLFLGVVALKTKLGLVAAVGLVACLYWVWPPADVEHEAAAPPASEATRGGERPDGAALAAAEGPTTGARARAVAGPGSVLRGRVFDAATGEPLAGAIQPVLEQVRHRDDSRVRVRLQGVPRGARAAPTAPDEPDAHAVPPRAQAAREGRGRGGRGAERGGGGDELSTCDAPLAHGFSSLGGENAGSQSGAEDARVK